MKTDKTRVTIRQATFEPFDPDREFVYRTARSRAGAALARVRLADPDGVREADYSEALAYYEKAKERCRQVVEARAAAARARHARDKARLDQARDRLRQLAPGLSPAQAYDAADRLPHSDAVRNAYLDWLAARAALAAYRPR